MTESTQHGLRLVNTHGDMILRVAGPISPALSKVEKEVRGVVETQTFITADQAREIVLGIANNQGESIEEASEMSRKKKKRS